ncbi:MAG: DNA translocase FtsK, partial [Candidatus Omnitrophota bacterium]
GVIGLAFSDFLLKYLGTAGTSIVIAVLLLLSVIITTDFLIFPFVITLIGAAVDRFRALKAKLSSISLPQPEPKTRILYKDSRVKARPLVNLGKPRPAPRPEAQPKPKPEAQPKPRQEAQKPKAEPQEPKPRPVQAGAQNKESAAGQDVSDNVAVEEVTPKKKTEAKPYTLPALDLLKLPPPVKDREIKDDLTENARILEEILSDFDIAAKVIEVNRGPVITRYELEPGAGVKVHRITSLSDNIALGMKAESVRIVAPVPGKGTVGVELPNTKGVFVYLRDVLESDEYIGEESKLKLALGKDIAGEAVIADLGDMPHLLIAGATGSGKTVCVNSIITSLLFNATPEEIRFIMVDPKKVELAPFNELPHLLCPVVTDYKKVPIALDWLVQEMEKRYELFAKCGVRNIDAYNKKGAGEGWEFLYYIVVVIDELADLMMVAQQEIESGIIRLAQLSRAVGIHMILATQRPSVDVITGVIKANFPARISFKVASKVDSRTVLDRNGAEKLLGKGDMLFIEPGNDKPVRAQGSLVFDEEIDRITTFIKNQREPEYEEAIAKTPRKAGGGGRFQKDEIYEEAVRIVLQTRQASVSLLQRKLGVGYTKAAHLIDMMEDDGIVGPYQGSKPRDVLVEETAENA